MSDLQTLQESSAFHGQSDGRGMNPPLEPGLGMRGLTAAEPVSQLPLDRGPSAHPEGSPALTLFATGRKLLIQEYVFLVPTQAEEPKTSGSLALPCRGR